MARDDGAGAGSVLLAFILGAVSGAAVALLYAPATAPNRNASITLPAPTPLSRDISSPSP